LAGVSFSEQKSSSRDGWEEEWSQFEYFHISEAGFHGNIDEISIAAKSTRFHLSR
jgi:hypothetical protein